MGERITAPILIIAGSKDGLTPPRDLQHVHKRIASRDKTFRMIGRATGASHDYSHADLILGLHAPDDVYPVIGDWLEAHRSAKPRPRQANVSRLRVAK